MRTRRHTAVSSLHFRGKTDRPTTGGRGHAANLRIGSRRHVRQLAWPPRNIPKSRKETLRRIRANAIENTTQKAHRKRVTPTRSSIRRFPRHPPALHVVRG